MRATQFALLAVVVIVALGFALLADSLTSDIEHENFQATEEVMVDMANVLAAIVQSGIKNHTLDAEVLHQAWPLAVERRFEAAIFDLTKTQITTHVYLTDEHGVVIYDSDNDLNTGRDLGTAKDVYLTLKGAYGARSSRSKKDDSRTSVLHVAAPVYDGKNIIGVLTVRKPKLDQWPFIQQRRSKIQLSSVLIGSGIALFVGAVLFWYLQPLRRLTAYVQAIKRGERPSLPNLRASADVNTLAVALEEMREELEGRDYAATYVQTLTHELKSPLAAIQATSELLAEGTMDAEQRQRFTDNLRHESSRAEHLLRQMLRLAEVERLKALPVRTEVDLCHITHQAVAELAGAAAAKQVLCDVMLPTEVCPLQGDPALLQHAVINLLENALDFSPAGGRIEVALSKTNGQLSLQIRDQGPGIPDYALPRVFERFYSLKHPLTGRKGSGLGLCFVREAAELHSGSVTLTNRQGGGAVAELILPKM
jgi:two-component system sensor histidine kinase CreC